MNLPLSCQGEYFVVNCNLPGGKVRHRRTENPARAIWKASESARSCPNALATFRPGRSPLRFLPRSARPRRDGRGPQPRDGNTTRQPQSAKQISGSSSPGTVTEHRTSHIHLASRHNRTIPRRKRRPGAVIFGQGRSKRLTGDSRTETINWLFDQTPRNRSDR